MSTVTCPNTKTYAKAMVMTLSNFLVNFGSTKLRNQTMRHTNQVHKIGIVSFVLQDPSSSAQAHDQNLSGVLEMG